MIRFYLFDHFFGQLLAAFNDYMRLIHEKETIYEYCLAEVIKMAQWRVRQS